VERSRKEWLEWIEKHELLGQCNFAFVQAMKDWEESDKAIVDIMRKMNETLERTQS